MKVYLVDTVLGIFILDEGGKMLRFESYNDSDDASQSISKINMGLAPMILDNMISTLNEIHLYVTDNRSIADILREKEIRVEFMKPCDLIENFRKSLPSFALSKGLIKEKEELNELERAVLLELAKTRVKRESAKRDIYAAQMVRALDDVDKSLNLFSGRIREWYGLHFPELDGKVESHETYLNLVSRIGRRSNWKLRNLEEIGLSVDKTEKLSIAARNSIGAEMSDQDIGILQKFCEEILRIFNLRNEINIHLEEVMEFVAPNLVSIAGSPISARLISLAGGIENLAMMPASTIQVLGAEKALFRALKTGARPPKHGVIFQHASIHQSSRWQRGKIARSLAAKIAIATRLDAYGGEFRGETLKADLDKRVEEIKKRYAKPPVKVNRRGRKRRGKAS